MKKGTFTIILLILTFISAVWFFYLRVDIQKFRINDLSSGLATARETSESNISEYAKSKIRKPKEIAGTKRRTPLELHANVWKAFNTSEASRSKLLLEQPGGGVVGYLVGIEPPTPGEIERMRKFVARVQDESEAMSQLDREEFDKWLGEAIDEYDPFGVTGRKVAFIRIPDDSKGRTSATVYTTDDFEQEVRRFQGLEENVFEMQSPRVYFTEPGVALNRFEELIKNPEK